MIDDFIRRALPLPGTWPHFDLSGLDYPEYLNAAVTLLDDAVAAGEGSRTAVLSDAGALTYAELKNRSDRIARLLADEQRLVPGNRVLLCGPNSPSLIAAWFAILKAGGIVVSVMPLLRPAELAVVIAKALISHAVVAAECSGALSACSGLTLLRYGDTAFETRLAAVQPGFEPVATRADDPAIIAFTSGTTGAAKGTVHFHRDLLIPADTFAAHVLAGPRGAVWSATPPLAFTFGLGALILFPFRFCGTSVTLSDTSPAGILTAIEQHRIGLLFTAPTAYKAMLAHGLTGYDLASLRTCVSAGEHLSAETFEAWTAATGRLLVNGIGSTEMMHIFLAAANAPPGSAGRAVPGYTVGVIDPDGRPVAEGEGRLAVRGPTGCRYLYDPRQSAYVVDGWNITGDNVRVDADGVFWYLARADDMIVSSGYNVAPPEVEAALCSHLDVAECAVIGVPDERRGQIVKAFVVTKAAPDAALVKALQDHVKAAIAPYKYPREIAFVSELPRTATGKIQRHRLRELS